MNASSIYVIVSIIYGFPSVLLYIFSFFVWREFTWILVILVYFMPFLDTYRYFVHTAEMKYYGETEGYTPISSVPINDSFAYLIPFMIISTICSVALNITSLLFVKQVKLRKKNEVESNFLIIMSITCTAQLFGMILSVSRVILAGTKVANTLAQILPFVSDGLTLVQPWLLVVFCHSVSLKFVLIENQVNI
ncbi:hypothetical protein CRE_23872 [Caenorhabditis remanei]|uniref:Serpentine receptor class gamma n=1 Tax=Caenorhabditis remanei TaxID=31234 RepID=E3NWW0_CAERE|nr:hypothetical protein CRE_23872 [Caenorhabditis remanei]